MVPRMWHLSCFTPGRSTVGVKTAGFFFQYVKKTGNPSDESPKFAFFCSIFEDINGLQLYSKLIYSHLIPTLIIIFVYMIE